MSLKTFFTKYNKLNNFEDFELNSMEIKEITAYINDKRQLYNAKPLKWSVVIGNYSQNIVNNPFSDRSSLYYENSCTRMVHSSILPITSYYNDEYTKIKLLKMAVDMWYMQLKSYDFKTNEITNENKNVIRLLCHDTTLFGMGYTKKIKKNGDEIDYFTFHVKKTDTVPKILNQNSD